MRPPGPATPLTLAYFLLAAPTPCPSPASALCTTQVTNGLVVHPCRCTHHESHTVVHTCTHLQHEYFSPTIGTGYTGGSYLVGVRMMAPIWLRLSSTSLLRIISMAGTTKARVFPDPVTASTHTSLFVRKSGIVAA